MSETKSVQHQKSRIVQHRRRVTSQSHKIPNQAISTPLVRLHPRHQAGHHREAAEVVRMVAARAEMEPHPLHGLRTAYYLCERKSMRDLSWLRRWLIRLVYAKCDWASDYCIHDMGIFTDREVAEEIAQQKSIETGNLWSAKELPVNGLLPEQAVRYGFYSFPTSEADRFYQEHRTKFDAIPSDALDVIDRKVARLWESFNT